jgi:hypothetical protein
MFGQLTIVVPGNRGIEDDDAQAVNVMHFVKGLRAWPAVKELLPEFGALVMIAHDPDDLGVEGLSGWLNEGAKTGVSGRLPLVGEVSRENEGVRFLAAVHEVAEDGCEGSLSINAAIQGRSITGEVNVTDVDQSLTGRRVLCD